MLNNKQKLWENTLSTLKDRVRTSAYESFIRNTKLHSFEENEFVVEAPNTFAHQFLVKNYTSVFTETLRELTGQNLHVTFTLNENANESKPVTPESPKKIISTPSIPQTPQVISSSSGSNLNSRYIFDNFVVGPHNKFAHAAASRVAESPGTTYNPLFIYGGVGLGKTHLMQAIGNQLLHQRQGFKIKYISSERFANELINAIRDNQTIEFKNRYRNIDLLLIDDIQFIGGKEMTQQEFFHTFNELYEAQKQIVISSDRPPSGISTLEDRLRSRFEMGLITDIQAPELETRIAILKKKIAIEQIDIEDDVLHFIAAVYKNNIRELEGALIKLMAYTSLTDSKPSVNIAQSVLGAVPKNITVPMIKEKTSEYFHLSIEDLISKSRTKEIVHARQIAIYLCCEWTQLSLPKIADHFGKRDHTTIMHARDKVKKLIQTNTKLKDDIDNIVNNLS